MHTKKAVILTEGNKKIAFGHISRCLALYDELVKRGFKVTCIINGDSSVASLLRGKRYKIYNWLINKKKLKDEIQGCQCIIIDSYLADESDYYEIAKNNSLLVCIDDNDRLSYPPGLVIKASQEPSKRTSKHNSSALLKSQQQKPTLKEELFGSKYQFLRKEFINVRAVKIRKEIRTFFVSFGGNDIRGLTPKVLRFLVKNYPHKNKIVIIGPAFSKNIIKQILSQKDSHTIICKNASAIEMRNNMTKSDVALTAGGQTLNELARIGLPTLAVKVVENQKFQIISWQKLGFIIYLRNYQKFDFTSIRKKIHELEPIQIRKKMGKAGRKIMDGKGPERIVREINKRIKNAKQ